MSLQSTENPNFKKDTKSGALINNADSLAAYKQARNAIMKAKSVDEEIILIKKELADVKIQIAGLMAGHHHHLTL